MKSGYVYILTNHSRTLYVGMTDDLRRRVFEHKTKFYDGFTQKYEVNQLVYYEQLVDGLAALAREKQLKGWTRAKKIVLIERKNPNWLDLGDRWYSERELETESLEERTPTLNMITNTAPYTG
jgi:putative endonuclease